MKCIGCQNKLEHNNYVRCNACNSCYCFACLNIDQSIDMDPANLANLKCPSCMNKNVNSSRRRHDNDSPLAVNQSFSFICTPGKKLERSISETAPVPISLADISTLLDQKLSPNSSNMKDLRAALYDDVKSLVLTELKSAIQEFKTDFIKTTDYIVAEVEDLKKQIKNKDQLITEITLKQSDLEKETINLKLRLTNMEKISRANNIEIQAVPERNNEDVYKIFKSICLTIGLQIPDADIHSCRRVAKMDPKSSRPRNLLVTLSFSRLRDNVISAVSRFNKQHLNNKLNSIHAGIDGESRRIYINEHLSTELKHLFSAVRKFAKDNDCDFVWVKYGQIYIRKNTTSKATRIIDMNFLNNLKL